MKFEFNDNKTFFGVTIYERGIKKSEIKKLPFFDYWEESAKGSTCALHEGETYVYLHDWERFCFSFILHGRHRHQK